MILACVDNTNEIIDFISSFVWARHGQPNALAGFKSLKNGEPIMCILIVEDDPTSAKVIEANLRKGGHETIIASTGKQALHYLSEQKFELIFLDVMIPEIGGLELLTKIKDHADQEKVPLIMCVAPTLEQIAALKSEMQI